MTNEYWYINKEERRTRLRGLVSFLYGGEEEVTGGSVFCFVSMWIPVEQWKQRGCSVDEDTAGKSKASQRKKI